MEFRTYKGVTMQKVGITVFVDDRRVGNTWVEAKRHIDAMPRCPVCATALGRTTHMCQIDGNYDPTVSSS
jgi:hypothetical protein